MVVYLVFVRTGVGQGLGDRAYLGRVGASGSTRRTSGKLLDLVNHATLVLLGVVVLLVGAVRRQPFVALVAAAAFTGAVVSAEVLKKVLPRPQLSEWESGLRAAGINTFPSGHSTIATGFVLAVVLLVAARWRPWMAVAGAVWVSLMTSGTLAAGWHRPSDAVGGVALATAWAALAAAWVLPRRFAGLDRPGSTAILLPGAIAILAIAALGLLAAVGLAGSSTDPGSPTLFLGASLVIDAISIGAVCLFAGLLRDVDTDRADHPGPATQA